MFFCFVLFFKIEEVKLALLSQWVSDTEEKKSMDPYIESQTKNKSLFQENESVANQKKCWKYIINKLLNFAEKKKD